jgi:ferric-dicitrate binding protein FerR (iron transport regulator)
MDRSEKARLIIGYLDGTLNEEEHAVLDDLLQKDPETTKLFCELSYQNTLLYRVTRDAAAREPRTAPVWNRRMAAAVAAAVFLAMLGMWILSGSGSDASGPEPGKTAGHKPIIPPQPEEDPEPALVIEKSYPAPQLTGGLQSDTHNPKRIVCKGKPGELLLGGYCRITAAPDTVFRVEGKHFAENIFLEQGEVTCDIDSGVGTFNVKTEVGTVHVKGTQFVVRLISQKGEEMKAKHMFVAVLMGAVLLTGNWGELPLVEGQNASTAIGGAPGVASGFSRGAGAPMVEVNNKLYVVTGGTLAIVDLATNKVIATQDLTKIASEIAEARVEKQRTDWIARFDKNGDGEIAGEELTANRWMGRMDKDGDGILGKEEVPVHQQPSPAAYGEADLLVTAKACYMLRNGILFIFNQTSLVFKTMVTIDENQAYGNRGDAGIGQWFGTNNSRPTRGGGDHGGRPDGKKREGEKKPREKPKTDNRAPGGGADIF